jgi:hypothetical protein
MLALPVPDYFQEDSEDALRSRVRWLENEIPLGASFLASVLRTDEKTLARWLERQAALPGEELAGLRQVWDMMMHILSFVNFDASRARQLLKHVAPAAGPLAQAGQTPPWAGSSIKTYLEEHGLRAVDDVSGWVTSFRFGAPLLTPEHEVPCPSSRD